MIGERDIIDLLDMNVPPAMIAIALLATGSVYRKSKRRRRRGYR